MQRLPWIPLKLCFQSLAMAVALAISLADAAFPRVAAAQGNPGAPGPARPAISIPRPKPFGESFTLRSCLVFTAKSVHDNQGDVENQDWVVLSVENHCPVPVVNLQAELLLLDTAAQLYGTTIWVVGQGEMLYPGQKWEDTVPVPDPDKRVPHAWTVRILRAETPLPQGFPRPTAPPDRR